MSSPGLTENSERNPCVGGQLSEEGLVICFRDKSEKSLLDFMVCFRGEGQGEAELDAEHAQKVLEMEHAQQMKLKERQKFFEEAFQQDMEQYLSTGYLQISERREPMGSMSSMEVNVDMLEQMDLMDISDQEALDVFLNSGGEENTLSPGLGPESEMCQNEITLQVPNPTKLPPKPPSSPSACTNAATQDAESGDGPLVQADEEEVQVDTALATFHTDGKVGSDSDSSQDV
ncbi:dysbindin isoform X2 [Fukomys damarensis]|uniref:dysbindin isoform X2 n=1 Tax=Fukomys damarensis TaxID=885580 RepID=UPI00053FDAE0|nr:dysbindin isoform X2 [Fukomys damarensis]